MDRDVMLERLEWLSKAPAGCETPDWLHEGDGTWASGIRTVATAALDEIKDQDRSFELRWAADMRAIKRWRDAAPEGEDRSLTIPDHADLCVWLLEQRAAGDWRPIAEAPIPPPDGLPTYWLYRCLIQDADGNVLAGFARYVETSTRGKSPRVLRWYEGVAQRYAIIEKPVYFQPLPQPRKD